MVQVIYEEMRFVTGSPYMVPHLAMKEGELGGYRIPKGAEVRVLFMTKCSAKLQHTRERHNAPAPY